MVLQITPRERQALQLLASGSSPAAVADRLGISVQESDALLKALFAALGAAGQHDAVTSAQRRGLLA